MTEREIFATDGEFIICMISDDDRKAYVEKTLQYVMGYSDVGVTLNVYTHASYDRAVEQMTKILDPGEQRGKHISYKCV